MADRMAQYSMLQQNNFNPAMLQHAQTFQMQQQQQQQQQVQQDGHQNMQPFPDQARMWAMQQMSNQFRPQNPSELNNAQMEMFRNQAMARAQGQQSQPPFNMNPGQQQGPFHDQQNQNQQHIPQGFQAPGVNRAALLQAAFGQNNGGGGAGAHVSRQLELMMAQNPQQQQHNFRMQQQQQSHQLNIPGASMNQQQLPPGMDIFSSNPIGDDGRRASPIPAQTQVQNMALANRSRPNLDQLRERGQSLRNMIASNENQMQQLNSQRSAMSDQTFVSKMRQLQNDTAIKRDGLAKLAKALQIPGPSVPQQGQNVQNQPWPQNQPQNLPFTNMKLQPPLNQPMPNLNLHPGAQNSIQRSGPTPLGPQLNPPFPNTMGTNMANQYPFSNNANPAANAPLSLPNQQQQQQPQPVLQLPPPLEKVRFEQLFSRYCQSKGVTPDPRILQIDNGGRIDLHALHTLVMQHGGMANVTNKDLWSVIGGQMGQVQFPASDTEPSRCGPGTAQHLHNVYKEYVAPFDSMYITSVLDTKRKQAQAAAQQAQQGQGPQQQQGPAPGQQQQGPGNQGNPSNSLHFQMVMNYADLSLQELRAKGLPDGVVAFIEQNRATLQKAKADPGSVNFRSILRGLAPGQPEQNGAGSVSQTLPFAPSPPQQIPQGPSPQPYPPQPNQARVMPTSAQQTGVNGFLQGGQPTGPRPGQREHLTSALAFIQKQKHEFSVQRVPHMRPVDIPAEQRLEYNTVIETLHRGAIALDEKLAMFCVHVKDFVLINKLITIIVTVQHQRNLMSSNTPRFVITLDMMKAMLAQLNQASDMFSAILAQQPRAVNNQLGPSPVPGRVSLPPHQPSPPHQSSPPQVAQHLSPPPTHPPTRSPTHTRQPSLKKSATGTAGPAVSTPTPPPSVSTPVASAPTPTHSISSPQAPKSPKTKAPPKPKQQKQPQRRASKAAPAPVPVDKPTPPATVPSPAGSMKRPREEDISSSTGAGQTSAASTSSVAHEASPPKRIKTEWDGPPDEALLKKVEEVENVKTEVEATAFYEQMSQLIQMASGGEPNPDLHDTLDSILKGCSPIPGQADLLGLGESSGMRNSPPPAQVISMDDFGQFFDFSSFDPDDPAKAGTPDLVSSSSTNTSPESVISEAETHHMMYADVKLEDFSDPLRMGTLKEIDGGESAYFQSTDWKYDSPMPTLEQPWAIFGS